MVIDPYPGSLIIGTNPRMVGQDGGPCCAAPDLTKSLVDGSGGPVTYHALRGKHSNTYLNELSSVSTVVLPTQMSFVDVLGCWPRATNRTTYWDIIGRAQPSQRRCHGSTRATAAKTATGIRQDGSGCVPTAERLPTR